MQIEKSLQIILPKRVKGAYVDKFRSVQIVSNFFEVKITKQFEKLFIFSIKFEPEIARDNRQKRKEILESAWKDISDYVPNPAICGMNLISTSAPIDDLKQFLCQEFKVTVKKVKILETKENPRTLLFFLNNRFRNVMSQTGYTQIGRTGKYFNIKSKRQIDNLNMYSGFKANFCVLQKGIFFRVDSAKKIVRNQTVLQYIDDLYKKNEGKDRDDKRNIVRNALINLIVQVNYGNGRYYKIEEVVYQDLTETFIEGEKMNMIEYYKNKYNITITKPKQPLLRAENKKGKIQILLVPQLCLMTGIPEDFDEFKRKKVSQQTILDARTKSKEIMSIMDEMKKTNDFEDLKKIGIQLSRKMYEMKGKQVPIPRLALGDDQKVQQGKEAFFNLFNQPIFAAKHSISLAIIYFKADLRDMIRTFQSTAKNLGVKLSYDKYEIRDDRRAVQQIGRSLKKATDNSNNVCLIIIPGFMKTQYKRIKQICLIENKMVCQIFTEPKLKNKNAQSIATKVLLQIIAKRGNTLWVPKTQANLQNTMLVGIDTAKIDGNRNILAACATVNSTFTSIYSKRVEFTGNQEKFSAGIKAILDIINYYVDRNKCPPKDIIMFTNSVSGDQIKHFQEYFIGRLLQQAQQIYNEKVPAMQVIMVNTKTSERFFTNNQQNVRAGTLINSDIVSPDYDFFLISQNSNRGCSVPNHYKVIFNNSKIQQGVLQQLVFSQCFNYVNWSGSIKIPGILQYAKKCAKFNSEVIQDSKISQSLEKCLYFV